MAVRNERMASHLLLGMVLGSWQCVGEILNPCEEQEDNTTYVALYTSSELNKTLPCECDITSDTTLEYDFIPNSGGGSAGKVTLWVMTNCTKEDFIDRKQVTGTHFRLVFRPTISTQVISVNAKEHFNVRCSRQVRSTSKPITLSTVYTTHLTGNKVLSEDIVICVICAVLGTVVALVIAAFCCIRMNRKPLADRSQASETVQPMTSLMACSSAGESKTLKTDTASSIDTSCRPLIGTGCDSVDDTVGSLNIPRQRHDDTYVTLNLTRDTTQGRVAPDACAIYDHSHPQEDIYHTLQREQDRQIIVDNIYNSISTQREVKP